MIHWSGVTKKQTKSAIAAFLGHGKRRRRKGVEMDIIERLEDDEMYVDAIDDAIAEIERLRRELKRANVLLDSRAGKLLCRGQFFLVIADDEPYFQKVYGMIRNQEMKEGHWSDSDEAMFIEKTNRAICPDCGADIPADGNCWYCENDPRSKAR